MKLNKYYFKKVKIITTSYRTQKCRHECQTLKTERWRGKIFKVQEMEQREKCSAGLPTGVQGLKSWWKENPSPKVILTYYTFTYYAYIPTWVYMSKHTHTHTSCSSQGERIFKKKVTFERMHLGFKIYILWIIVIFPSTWANSL